MIVLTTRHSRKSYDNKDFLNWFSFIPFTDMKKSYFQKGFLLIKTRITFIIIVCSKLLLMVISSMTFIYKKKKAAVQKLNKNLLNVTVVLIYL